MSDVEDQPLIHTGLQPGDLRHDRSTNRFNGFHADDESRARMCRGVVARNR